MRAAARSAAGAMLRAAGGATSTAGAAAGIGLRNWGRVFGTRFFTGLIILLGLILLVVPGIVLAVRYCLIDEVVVLEGVGGGDARERSRALVRGRAI